MTAAGAWIEGMRLRTLPVSMAGVVAATGATAAARYGVDWPWALVCLLFAVLAQIASNFANEYFDFRAGFDGDGRRGPQRGVANGIITPRAMLRATILTLVLACAVGLLTVIRGGWWLIPCGVCIAAGALAYSAGPYPLSRHGLGEVAVVVFYGIVPVALTFYVLTGSLPAEIYICGLGVGLWGSMVILVNNYRDIDQDRSTGKLTLSTRIGPQGSGLLYMALGQLAALSLAWCGWGLLAIIPALLGFVGGELLYMQRVAGAKATKLLAITAMSMLLTSVLYLIISLLNEI